MEPCCLRGRLVRREARTVACTRSFGRRRGDWRREREQLKQFLLGPAGALLGEKKRKKLKIFEIGTEFT